MMDHQKKLDFVLKMTKHALDSVQHLDSGGTVLNGPQVAGSGNAVNPANQGIAGSVGNFLGTNNNFQASGASITPGTNVGQLNAAYTGAQGALGQAGALTNTLNPGVAQGVGSQGLLTNQLTAQSQGLGPNPAQNALNQNTGQNIAQAAALAAGTRGAGTNAGLIASNAAQQGAATQQQAVGQAATLGAQQQLAAQGQLANLAGTQVNQGTGAVQLGNQVQQGEQGLLQGANASANNENVAMQSNINTTNAAVAEGNQKANSGLIGQIGSGIGSLGAGVASLFADGGEVKPEYKHLHGMAKIFHPSHLMPLPMKNGGQVPGKPKVDHDAYKNDTVSAKLSPGEVVIDLNTLKDKGKLGQMARFVAANIERKKAGRSC